MYKVEHHFEFRPCLHYSSISNKTYLSCCEDWVEVPNWLKELNQIEIVEPDVLSNREWEILKQWSE